MLFRSSWSEGGGWELGLWSEEGSVIIGTSELGQPSWVRGGPGKPNACPRLYKPLTGLEALITPELGGQEGTQASHLLASPSLPFLAEAWNPSSPAGVLH